jgi:hypothetical protein
VTPYNGYLIEVFESSGGRWRIRVRREDGRNIVTAAGEYQAVTSDIESLSVADAVIVAKAVIDIVIAERVARTMH